MSNERAYTCGLYLPGHDIHWIQAQLAARNDPKTGARREAAPGHLLEVGPDGRVVVEVQGAVLRLWNHNPGRLEQLVARNHGQISHQPGFGLLRTASEGGNYLFCVAEADSPDLRPCPETPLTGGPLELLRDAGGFSMSGPEALRWAEHR